MSLTKMENQNPSRPAPSVACTAARPGNWKEPPTNTADMTIDELMAYIREMNKKYRISR